MGRRTGNLLDDQHLEQEEIKEEIQNDNQDNEVNPVENEEIQENNLSNDETESPVEEHVFNIGDKVKLKPGIGSDIQGKRIHAGVRNYVYTIKNIRQDGYLLIECLTRVFTVSSNDVVKEG